MSQVDFGEDKGNNFSNFAPTTAKRSGMVDTLIKWGVTDNEKTAEVILLISGISFFIISGVIVYGTFVGFNRPPAVEPEQVLQQKIDTTPGSFSDEAKQRRVERLKNQIPQ